MVIHLRALDCDHQIKDKEGNGIGHLAARQGHVHVLENLMDVIFTEARNQDGQRVLHLAAEGGHLDCVKLLLDNHSQINVLCNVSTGGKQCEYNWRGTVRVCVVQSWIAFRLSGVETLDSSQRQPLLT
ncbi:hypothetical protein scyTo_0022351 [Scyliorhinus torazame]|uniref:Uncharacterized protein n=1 Tax=Scyliorhinus torazame TaxID=75743 RepID=A0A401QB01_SCYTO|nr:hypothetical protein [Scyliorhinus torazame]